MREYTLNDVMFNQEPLTLFTPDPNYRPDKAILESGYKKNGELLKKFQEQCWKQEKKA